MTKTQKHVEVEQIVYEDVEADQDLDSLLSFRCIAGMVCGCCPAQESWTTDLLMHVSYA